MTNEEVILKNQFTIMEALILLINPDKALKTPKLVIESLYECLEETEIALK